MITVLAIAAVIDGLALAALLCLARHSVMLVDEDGRPYTLGPWTERRIAHLESPRTDHRTAS